MLIAKRSKFPAQWGIFIAEYPMYKYAYDYACTAKCVSRAACHGAFDLRLLQDSPFKWLVG